MKYGAEKHCWLYAREDAVKYTQLAGSLREQGYNN